MRRLAAIGACVLALMPAVTSAEPTAIVVRVLSEGGKYVGTSMGGAKVVVRDTRTGAVLASGQTSGTTGDTRRIMAGGPRGAPLADEASAAFRAEIDLDAPRLVEIEVFGPLAQPQAAVRVTTQRWLVPGQAPVGDGFVVELPGLVVDVTDPAAHQRQTAGASIRLAANIALMCGCPIEPGGIWDAARFDVRASIRRDDQPAGEVRLGYGGRTGLFTGEFVAAKPGAYVVTITAVDSRTGAAGVDFTSVIVN